MWEKYALTEILERYLEHQAYDNPATASDYRLERSKTGVQVFKSSGKNIINELEELVGQDSNEAVDLARDKLTDYLKDRLDSISKQIGRKVRYAAR